MFISLHRYFGTKKLLLLLARNTCISPYAQKMGMIFDLLWPMENIVVILVSYGLKLGFGREFLV